MIGAIERLNDHVTRTGSCYGLWAWTLEHQLYRPQNDALYTSTDDSETPVKHNTTRHVCRSRLRSWQERPFRQVSSGRIFSRSMSTSSWLHANSTPLSLRRSATSPCHSECCSTSFRSHYYSYWWRRTLTQVQNDSNTSLNSFTTTRQALTPSSMVLWLQRAATIIVFSEVTCSLAREA